VKTPVAEQKASAGRYLNKSMLVHRISYNTHTINVLWFVNYAAYHHAQMLLFLVGIWGGADSTGP
jgi:hypothetical protein